MEYLEKLLKTSLTEIERLLTSKAVVGEPISAEGSTIIPLSSIGFGFGAGGGTGKEKKAAAAEGTGAGTGGGGGIKPVAVIIIGKDGVRVEPIKGAARTAMIDKVGEVVNQVLDRRADRKSADAGSEDSAEE